MSIVISALIFFPLTHYTVRHSALGEMTEALESVTPVKMPSFPQYETKHVKPRSKEACLQITGGVANEQYKQCREGYKVRVRVTN